MTPKDDLLAGKIAVELGLLTQEQLDAAVKLQEEDVHVRPLGSILVERGYLKKDDLARVLAVQRERMQKSTDYSDLRRENVLFGKLVVRLGLVDEEKVNECLRIQAKVESEVEVRLGEILVKKGYLSREGVKKVLSIQNKTVLVCRSCSDQVNVVRYVRGTTYRCPHCGADLDVAGPAGEVDVRKTLFLTQEDAEKIAAEIRAMQGGA